MKNFKFIALLTGILSAAVPYVFAFYLVVAGKADVSDTLKAFGTPDPIYTLSQQYVDDHKVVIVPNANAPIVTPQTAAASVINPPLTEAKTIQDAVSP